jgi:GST-like protein
LPYAIDRFTRETERLHGVLDQRLADRPDIAEEHYTVADIAVYPWVVPQEPQRQDLNAFVHVKHWFTAIAARPATARAYACTPQFSAHRALS